jgi:precorrin-4 methylase
MKKWVSLFLMSIIFVISLFTTCYGQLQKGKIYVVGVGPSGPELCTLQAIKVIQEADIVYAPIWIKNLFSNYLAGKEVRETFLNLGAVRGKAFSAYGVGEGAPYTALFGKDLIEYTTQLRMSGEKGIREMKSEAEKGKAVAYLVVGDPCIYSDLRWFKTYLNENDYVVIPGLSSLNAGAALLKKELAPSDQGYRNAIIVYSPYGEDLGGSPRTTDYARHKTTMIFFMAGSWMKDLVRDLNKHYNKNTPVAACYFIGYPGKEKIIKGRLDNIVSLTAREPETDMVLIFVGNFLNE